MLIISEKTMCSTEIANKMVEFFENEVDLKFFGEEFCLEEDNVVLCSLDGKYNSLNLDSTELVDFIVRWVENIKCITKNIDELSNVSLTFLINYETENLVNNFIASIVSDASDSIKDKCSINLLKLDVELMPNSNYARMKFGYTECFTKANIDKIKCVCDSIKNNTSKHCGSICHITF